MSQGTSYNGWPADTQRARINVEPFIAAGVDFPGGVRRGDVATVLRYVAEQFNTHVEPLVNPGCWGYSFRLNRNAHNLSCHASGTAIDCNAPQHPNGIEASHNFSRAQIDAVHKILASIDELDEVVHWGGDWHAPALRPDPMHFEIHDHDLDKLSRVAKRIRDKQMGRTVNNNVSRLRAEVLAACATYGDHIPTKRRVARAWVAAIRRIAKTGPKS